MLRHLFIIIGLSLAATAQAQVPAVYAEDIIVSPTDERTLLKYFRDEARESVYRFLLEGYEGESLKYKHIQSGILRSNGIETVGLIVSGTAMFSGVISFASDTQFIGFYPDNRAEERVAGLEDYLIQHLYEFAALKEQVKGKDETITDLTARLQRLEKLFESRVQDWQAH